MTCRSLERINSCYGNIRLEKRGLKASIKSIKRNNNLNLNKHHQLQAEKRHQRKPQSIYYFRMITSITHPRRQSTEWFPGPDGVCFSSNLKF